MRHPALPTPPALPRLARLARAALAGFTLAVLAACGGGGKDTATPDANFSAQNAYPGSNAEAQRFLTQASFGPTDATVEIVNRQGFGGWIDAQMAMPQAQTHVAYFDLRDAAIKAVTPTSGAGWYEVNQSFWHHALTADDQLRQRVALALSEIFVVSSVADCVSSSPRGLASYYDTLADNAFADFRVLLEKVTLHPIMGCYLSHLKNQRENTKTGRVPDENYAREVMQLFSIGLYQLNADGSLKTDGTGNAIETYNAADVAGLAKVFTGFSFDCPMWPSDSCFYYGVYNDGSGQQTYSDMWTRGMVGYPQYHSKSVKAFLGQTIAEQNYPDPQSDLKLALDTLALRHGNVGPFIGRQLIQRLVTSNPSAAYVGRVTAAFEASGRNLGAMVRAILTDAEARDMDAALASTTAGKVREPVLRLSAFLRAMGTSSDSGMDMIDPTDDVGALSQSPLRSPSVFNFFRPGYVYPGGQSADQGLVTPELQIANESTTAGYVNYMRDVISSGVGRYQLNSQGVSRRDVRLSYSLDTTNIWYATAKGTDAGPLVDRINVQLMYGAMPAALRTEIKDAVETITLSATPTESQVRNRLHAALLLTVASPEFLVQK